MYIVKKKTKKQKDNQPNILEVTKNFNVGNQAILQVFRRF